MELMHEKALLNGYHASVNYGSLFVQIFRQTVTKSVPNLFVDDREANFSLKKNKFSVLKFIDDKFRNATDNTFEFIIYYKELNEIIHWTQKISIHTKTNDTEYEIKHSNSTLIDFRGIGLSINDNNAAYLDGEPSHTNWWFSIGLISIFSDKGIPGSVHKYANGYKNYVVHEVSMWVRIDNMNLLYSLPALNRICSMKMQMHRPVSFIASLLVFVSR